MTTETATAAPAGVTPAAPTSAERDVLGRAFDPTKFKPEKDTAGRWKNLRGGRKPGSKSKPKPPADSAGTPAPAPDFSDVHAALKPEAGTAQTVEVMTENATAESIIGVIQTALILIGDDEGILSDVEKTMLRAPLIRVLSKYNVSEKLIPCEAELALACAGLIVARLQKPKTATWFAKAKHWAIGFFFRRKGDALASAVRREVAPAPAT